VRFTTGRGLAERAIDLAFRKMGRTPPPCRTAWTRVSDARFARFSDLRDSAVKAYPSLAPEVVTHLVHNHGIAYRAVMDLACATPALAERVGTSLTLKAEVVHGIRAEMAQKLSDIVLRRTGLGTGAFPGEPALAECGGLMAAELGWSADRTRDEMDAVRANYSSWRRGAEVGR
jgi:glycerol-3-phosphate dehydrogenase